MGLLAGQRETLKMPCGPVVWTMQGLLAVWQFLWLIKFSPAVFNPYLLLKKASFLPIVSLTPTLGNLARVKMMMVCTLLRCPPTRRIVQENKMA